MRSILPITPSDGQIFIDSEMVKWIYNANLDLWERAGTVIGVPLADADSDGYMSYQDKALLDSIPQVPGGFGIITDTKLLLKSDTNPDGVISGDIQLVSDSLDIRCVDVNDTTINYTPTDAGCPSVSETQAYPGLQFKLSENFLKSLLVNLPGNTGKKGKPGPKGADGKPGFAGGPPGLPGVAGISIDELASLESIEFNDVDGVTDTAVVGMQLVDAGSGCKLVLDKSRLNISTSAAADKIIATPVVRNLSFPASGDCPTGMKGWSLGKGSDDAPVNLSLIKLPKGAGEGGSAVGFNAGFTLNTFITQIVAEYDNILKRIDETFGKEAREFVLDVDSKARTILNNLAGELASCEFNLPAAEYCITFTGCDQPPATTDPTPPTQPNQPDVPVESYSLDTIESGITSIVEGDTLNFKFTATNVDPTTYDFEVTHGETSDADFTKFNGSFKSVGTKESNSGEFWIQTKVDSVSPEPTETFSVAVSKDGKIVTVYGPIKLTNGLGVIS